MYFFKTRSVSNNSKAAQNGRPCRSTALFRLSAFRPVQSNMAAAWACAGEVSAGAVASRQGDGKRVIAAGFALIAHDYSRGGRLSIDGDIVRHLARGFIHNAVTGHGGGLNVKSVAVST
jgi:hypothetical protein